MPGLGEGQGGVFRVILRSNQLDGLEPKSSMVRGHWNGPGKSAQAVNSVGYHYVLIEHASEVIMHAELCRMNGID